MDKEKFLRDVLKEVKFGYDKSDIEAELLDHINERSLYLQQKGQNPDSAEAEAIERMGNPSELGKQLNKAHNPWLGWLWILSGITLSLLLIGVVILGGPKATDKITHIYSQLKNEIGYEERYVENWVGGDIITHMDCDDVIKLDGYSIRLKSVYCKRSVESCGGYYIFLFYKIKGSELYGLDEYAEPNIFLDKKGETFAKRKPGEDDLQCRILDNMTIMWVPDLSEDCIYIDYNMFGQRAKTIIDISDVINEMKELEVKG